MKQDLNPNFTAGEEAILNDAIKILRRRKRYYFITENSYLGLWENSTTKE